MRGSAFFHFVKFFIGNEKAYTQTTPSEMALIKKYAAQKKYAVEIGVYEAVNTVAIAGALEKDAVFYAIDPFFKSKLGFCYYKWITYLNLYRNKVLKKVTVTEAYSYAVADKINNTIDFIFIDGDHSYEGLQKDWELYSPKIVAGGYMLLHDTTVPDFDPWRANLGSIPFFKEVVSIDPRFRLVETVDSLNVLQRVAE
ncbi:MAG: class I SAM-dependent methyltransferase [Chitinophagaceae bacterium]|nr:class I SAM-dependent methyltransferase [Chitinophagaceae bacterium]